MGPLGARAFALDISSLSSEGLDVGSGRLASALLPLSSERGPKLLFSRCQT
jgi:hypothetical protein